MTNSPGLNLLQYSTPISTRNKDLLGWVVIIVSSILLGIWALKGTIALRNILLGVGALVSLVYCMQLFKGNSNRIPLKNWIPFISLGLIFCWVIFHYLFLSRFPDVQLHELISTWLRSGLSVILALATGLALSKRPVAINCLWIGILGSFVYLFYQYIPKAIADKSLFAIDYGYYIYRLKISGVLMGTILVVGLLGTFIDTLRRAKAKEALLVGLLWLFGTLAPLYSFVFIFDSRSGVGLSLIMFAIAFCMVIWHALSLLFLKRGWGNGSPKLLALIICTAGMVGWLGGEHIKRNPGWSTMWEDAKISIQVEKYPNWQNIEAMGHPKNANGEVVKFNTYQRLAWAVAGFQIFSPENPLGLGVLNQPFTRLVKEKYPNAGGITGSHSAWVDITLAYGYPGVFLFLTSLLFSTFLSIHSQNPFKSLTGLFSVGLILLYTVGEISSQHSIEILCFCISLISAILLPIQNSSIELSVPKRGY